MCWNIKASTCFLRQSSEAFIHPRTFILLSQGLCLLCLDFIMVILMVNIKKVNIIMFVFHFPARWPFNSLDRLLCSWQQHGNFFRPLTYMMWGSTLQLSTAAFTRWSRPLTLSGWHSDGRASQDCLQMFFWGASSLFNKRMWNINLPSPLHCIICEVIQEVMLIRLPVLRGAS